MGEDHLVQLDDYRGYEIYFNKNNNMFTAQRQHEIIARSVSWSGLVRQIKKNNYDPEFLKTITPRTVFVKHWNEYVEAKLTGKIRKPENKYSYSYNYLNLEVVIPGEKGYFELPENIFLLNKEEVELIRKLKHRSLAANRAFQAAESNLHKNCITLFMRKGKLPV